MQRQFCYWGATLVTSGASWACSLFLARALSLVDYGVWSLLVGAAGLFGALAMFGQATALSAVFFNDERRDTRNVTIERSRAISIIFVSALVFGAVASLVVASGYNLISIPKSVTVGVIALVLVWALVRAVFDLEQSLLTCFDEYRWIFRISVLAAFVLLLGVLLYPSIEGFLGASLLASGVGVAIVHRVISVRFMGERRSAIAFSRFDLIRLGWPAIPGMALGAISILVDRGLIGAVLSLEDVAVYTLATALSTSVARVLVTAMLRPNIVLVMTGFQNRDYQVLSGVFRNVSRTLIAMVVFAAVASILGGKTLIALTLGMKYGPAVPLIAPLFAIAAIEGLVQISSQGLIQQQKLHLLVGLQTITLVGNAVLAFVAMRFLGLIGLICSWFIMQMVSWGCVAALNQRLFPGSAIRLREPAILTIIFIATLILG